MNSWQRFPSCFITLVTAVQQGLFAFCLFVCFYVILYYDAIMLSIISCAIGIFLKMHLGEFYLCFLLNFSDFRTEIKNLGQFESYSSSFFVHIDMFSQHYLLKRVFFPASSPRPPPVGLYACFLC